MPIRKFAAPFVTVTQGQRKFYLTCMTAGDLVRISYASVRGELNEEGAVQRILNPRRISSLKEFALAGGDYPNSIVLNWVNRSQTVTQQATRLLIPIVPHSAQIIDGQHRLAGLREAIKSKKTIASVEIPVALYSFLTTQQCADIFISINTEQRQAPRSLVYDLYGEASEHVVDPAAVRATDIGHALNEEEGSPYFSMIKFPSAPMQGGIALSTLVSALKPLVEDKGIFEQVGVEELEMQKEVVKNYFQALQDCYGDRWSEKDNVFLTAAGFSGAVQFLQQRLINYCNIREDFTKECMRDALVLDTPSLLWRSDLKGLQGRESTRRVFDHLVDHFEPKTKKNANIKI